jgi:enoyl-CoA hydratase/carnithine racemase
LALACDWRVTAKNAAFYLPEAKVGLNMGWSAIPRLTSLIGPARTKRAILLAENLTTEMANEWGLIDEIAENGHAVEVAQNLARRAEECPGALLRMTKELSTPAIQHCIGWESTWTPIRLSSAAIATKVAVHAKVLSNGIEKQAAANPNERGASACWLRTTWSH